jgi:CheY-like chemotaxis protein
MSSILFVDDEAGHLELFRFALRDLPYTLLTAQGANEATKILNDETPELIVLDVAMPGISGLDLLHQLRADDRWAATKIILATAVPMRVPKEDAESVHRVLPKPFELDQLEEAVLDALAATRS